MGDENTTTTTDTTAPVVPATTVAAPPATPPAQVAPPPAAKTFTQEELNDIVKRRLEEDRARRAPAPTPKPAAAAPPAGNDSLLSGMPDIQAMIVREGDFREEMVRFGASPEQVGLARRLLTVDNPADVRAWCQANAPLMGLGKSPAPPAVTPTTTTTIPTVPQARPASDKGSPAPPTSALDYERELAENAIGLSAASWNMLVAKHGQAKAWAMRQEAARAQAERIKVDPKR